MWQRALTGGHRRAGPYSRLPRNPAHSGALTPPARAPAAAPPRAPRRFRCGSRAHGMPSRAVTASKSSHRSSKRPRKSGSGAPGASRSSTSWDSQWRSANASRAPAAPEPGAPGVEVHAGAEAVEGVHGDVAVAATLSAVHERARATGWPDEGEREIVARFREGAYTSASVASRSTTAPGSAAASARIKLRERPSDWRAQTNR